MNLKRLVIIGGTGIGRIAESLSALLGFSVLGYLNDEVPAGSVIGRFGDKRVLGRIDEWEDLTEPDVQFVVAVGAMQRSEHFLGRIRRLGLPHHRFASLIDPSSLPRDDSTRVGKGVLIAPGAQVSVDTEIGDHCALMGGSYLGHDSVLRDFARLAAGCVVGGSCVVGEGVFVGTNATLREFVTVGDYSLVGSGSVVLEDVPPRSVVAGNPARLIRMLSGETP